MKVLRTPESRFDGLEGYPFAPHYVNVADGLRMHYVDEGPPDGAPGRFEKPFLCVFGRNDPILGKLDRILIEHVPGAKGQPHDRIKGGHFIQEDQGEELAKRLVEWAS